MSVRICPRCSTLIESRSAIFCYNCGQELERPNLIEETENSITETITKSSKKSRLLVGFKFFAFAVPFLFLVLSFSLFYVQLNYRRADSPFLKPSSNDFVSTVSALPISPFTFGKYNFASLVPATADLYLESYNPKLFLEKLLTMDARQKLEDKVGLNLDETTSFFEREFAYAVSSSSAALITVGKDAEFLKTRAAKIADPKIKIFSAEPYFVLSNSESFLKEIAETTGKRSLSLSSLAKFQETLKKLPDRGQILIYSTVLDRTLEILQMFFRQDFDLTILALKGTSFVITAGGGNTVVQGLNFK